MTRKFTPHFSDAARERDVSSRLAEDNETLRAKLSEAEAQIERLTRAKSEMANKLNSEAFRLKAMGPCYSGCPVFKPRSLAT